MMFENAEWTINIFFKLKGSDPYNRIVVIYVGSKKLLLGREVKEV